MKNLQLLLKVVLFSISLSVASLANPVTGYFSSQGVKLQPRDFIIVHEEDEGRIRLHLTDLSLSEDQKKYLAGNQGNNFSENTVQFYIPVQLSPGGAIRDKSEDVKTHSFGKTGGYWKLPAQHFKVIGSLNNLHIQARGQKSYRDKMANYDFRVQGKVYSAAERARKPYPRIAAGDKEIGVEASWKRDAVTPVVTITIYEGSNGSGKQFANAKDISQLINALKSNRPYRFDGLDLTPQNKGFLLQTKGIGKKGPKKAFIDQSQARQLASQVDQAARHLGILK